MHYINYFHCIMPALIHHSCSVNILIFYSSSEILIYSTIVRCTQPVGPTLTDSMLHACVVHMYTAHALTCTYLHAQTRVRMHPRTHGGCTQTDKSNLAKIITFSYYDYSQLPRSGCHTIKLSGTVYTVNCK